MNLEIFTTDEERATAIQRLDELRESEGWRIMLKALDLNLESFTDELLTTEFAALRPVERLQDRINDLRKLKRLPTLLIEEAKNISLPAEEDPDPYKN